MDQVVKPKTMPHRSNTHREMFFHVVGAEMLAPYRGATVFFREEAGGGWNAAVSLCSPGDDFCRRRGRTIARRRYFNMAHGPQYHRHGLATPTYSDAMYQAHIKAEQERRRHG